MNYMDLLEPKYKELVSSYLKDQNEQVLYQGQKLSRKLIEHNITPEEIVNLHKSIIVEEKTTKEDIIESFDVLLEVMIGYGLAYREHQSLRSEQMALKSEIEVAASMQETLLNTHIPQIDGLEIGAISVPARQMNGDYHHFVKDDEQRVGVAIADVIGKGIPAALSMSMIKYAIDSYPDYSHSPSVILEALNRIVEQNVDPSMFITMCYGVYHSEKHTFSYSTAGHEPGFYYEASTGQFHDLDGRGLLLGIEKKVKYQEYNVKLSKEDMIILLSDGVAECKTETGFFERAELHNQIKKYIHLPTQEIVTNVYKDLERLQGFVLRDDFTLIILKRTK